MDHVLRSCTVAKGVWTRLLPPARWESFFGLPFPEWLRLNLFDKSFFTADAEWGVRFAITCWLLWKRRCRLLFESGEGMMDEVLSHGGRLVEECSRASSVNTGAQAGRLRTSTWSKPHLGYRCVEVESDCLDAVRIAMARSKTLDGSALVCSIHRLLSNDWSVVVSHVDRRSNGVADALARKGRGSSMAPVNLFEVPDEVACMVESEREVPFDGRGSSLALTALDEREVPFDPGGFS
ncbi:hypothetical protein V6N13_009053 [Hibiscus sabdariffa]